MDVGVYVRGVMIEWCFQVECLPDALIHKGVQHCSAAPCLLQKSSVPPLALSVSAFEWLDWEQGLSVSILHIDLNDYYTLATAASLWELTSAFTSTQTVSLHTQPCVQDPPL